MADTPEDLGKSSIDNLTKAFQQLKKEAEKPLDSLVNAIFEVDDAARKLSKEFGIGDELIRSMKAGMTDAVTEVTKLGGKFSDIAKIQSDVAGALGRNVILSSDLYGKLYAAYQVTNKTSKEIVENFRNVGASSFQAAEGMKEVVNVARSQGVNAQIVSGEVLKNMEKMNLFTFQGGVEGLAKMASQAVGLRINMNETLDLAEELLQPERAIEMAASLQRLGVAQTDLLDPLRLMDLAQNDPTELQNQIVKMTEQFVQLNEKGRFEIMPGARRQLMEISKEMGISYNELTKMALGSADLDKKMREIDFGGSLNLTEDQKKLIANMAEMGKGGEYVVRTQEGEKKITELKKEDIDYLAEASKPKSLEELQDKQLTVQEKILAMVQQVVGGPKYAVAGSKPATDITQTIKSGVSLASKTLSPEIASSKNIREGIDKNVGNMLDSVEKLITGKDSLMDFISALSGAEKNVINFTNLFGENVFKTLDEGISNAAKSSNIFERLPAEFIQMFGKIINKEMQGGSSLPSQTTTSVKDAIIINKLPEDSVREVNGLAVGTNLGGGMTGEQKLTGAVDVNLNINLNSNNTNVSANDIISAMRSGEVQQQLISSITDAINNGMKGNTNPQLNPYSANPLLSV